MPCYDSQRYDRVDLNDALVRLDELKEVLDERTAQLCEVLMMIDGTHQYWSLSEDIRKWHAEHKKFDKNRA